MNEILTLLNSRGQDFDQTKYSYKLHGGEGYGLSILNDDDLQVDEGLMAAIVPFADGNRRDGVGDLLEVGGIDTSRHQKNPIVLFDHGKDYKWPIALAEHPETHEYSCIIDPISKTAKDLCFFYRGTGMKGIEKDKEYEHAKYCEQLFHLWTKRFIRAGSIGYLVKAARELPPDYERGIPKGAHLLSVMKLETSIVVLPCNADTVKSILAMPKVCDRPLSPYLVKSLSQYVPQETKVQVGYTSKGMSPTKEIQKVGEWLSKHGLMPGYGQIFIKENGSGSAWYVGGDGDEDGFEKLVKEKLSGIEGIDEVIYEAEVFPPDNEGWIEVYPKIEERAKKSLPQDTTTEPVPHSDTNMNSGVNNPPPQSRQAFLTEGVKPDDLKADWVKSLRGKYREKRLSDRTDMSPQKARKILHDKEVHGHPLTEKQRGLFGAIASEGKSMAEETAPVVEEETQEPYSAQVMRHLHGDGLERMQHYDSVLPYLEHPEIKKHLVKILQTLEKELSEREDLWDKHHKPNGLKDLEGRVAEEDAQEEIEEGEEEEEQGEEEEARGEEEQERGEEELEEAEEKTLTGAATKTLTPDTKTLRGKYRQKSMCPQCGSDPCVCNAEDVPGYEEHHEHPGEDVDPAGDTDLGYEEDQEHWDDDEDEGSNAEGTDLGFEEDQEHEGTLTGSLADAFNDQERKFLEEAKGFIDELGGKDLYGGLSDEERHKSYHYGKTLSDIAIGKRGQKGDRPEYHGNRPTYHATTAGGVIHKPHAGDPATNPYEPHEFQDAESAQEFARNYAPHQEAGHRMKDMGDDTENDMNGEDKGLFDPKDQALSQASSFLMALSKRDSHSPFGNAFQEKCESCSKALQDALDDEGDTEDSGTEAEHEEEDSDESTEDTTEGDDEEIDEDEGDYENEEALEEEGDAEGEEEPQEEVIGFDDEEFAKSQTSKPKKLPVKTKSDPRSQTKVIQPTKKEKVKTNPNKPKNRLKEVFSKQKQLLDAQSAEIDKVNKQLARIAKIVQ